MSSYEDKNEYVYNKSYSYYDGENEEFERVIQSIDAKFIVDKYLVFSLNLWNIDNSNKLLKVHQI